MRNTCYHGEKLPESCEMCTTANTLSILHSPAHRWRHLHLSNCCTTQ